MKITKEVEKEIFGNGIEIITECHNFEELLTLISKKECSLSKEGNIMIPLGGKSYLMQLKDLDENTTIHVEEGEVYADKLGNISGKSNILRVHKKNLGQEYKTVTLILKNDVVTAIMLAPYNEVTSPYVTLQQGTSYKKNELLELFSKEKYVVVK